MGNQILISVVTITYNCERSIENTIVSVLNQNYKDVEYIIIDGKSSDNTLKIINKYQSRISKVISEPDRGISDAFNKGVRAASGELIILLNSGDCFINENVLSEVAKDYNETLKDVLFYNVRLGNRYFISDDDNDGEVLWRRCHVPHQGAFVRKEVFDRVGYFDEKYKLRMDLDFWARCTKQEISHIYIHRVVVDYEVGGVSMRAENAKRFYKEGFEIKKKYNIKISREEYLYAIIPKWVRRLRIRLYDN